MPLHPILADAGEGRLPPWAEVSLGRLDHIGRVAALMDSWAKALGVSDEERRRWRAAAWLHDALRDADPRQLRATLPEETRTLPGLVLHGPAVAERLRVEGVEDEAVLLAIAYHTLGHPALGRLGRALYLADFLEPGRGFEPLRRASLRARMPGSMEAVLRSVVGARLRHVIRAGHALSRESVDFWNAVSGGR